MAKHWMASVAKNMNKGGLHRALGVPEGKTIPAKKMAQAAKSKSPKVRKMVGLDKAFASARHAHQAPTRG